MERVTAPCDDALGEVNLDRVARVLVTDRLRNGGASQPFGEGDTPIRAVVALLAASAPSVPMFVGYDYIGLRSATDEVRSSLQYVGKLHNS